MTPDDEHFEGGSLEYPIDPRPIQDLTKAQRLERRTELHAHRIERSLRNVRRAVDAAMHPERLAEAAERQPYMYVGAGLVAGALLGIVL